MTIGASIREARKRKGWSQLALARALGVGNNTVSRWETGVYAVGTDMIFMIEKLLGTVLLRREVSHTPLLDRLMDIASNLPDEAVRELISFAKFKSLPEERQ